MDKGKLNKQIFLSMAEVSGLDVRGSYIESLYTYVERAFPDFKVAEKMDLMDVEPMLTFNPSKE